MFTIASAARNYSLNWKDKAKFLLMTPRGQSFEILFLEGKKKREPQNK